MGIIDFTFVHTCQILRDTGTTQNAAGSLIPNIVTTNSSCLFSNVSTSGNYISDTEAGKVIVSSTMVFLPANVTIQEGDSISTTEPHFAGTYKVQKVDAPEILGTDSVDHLEVYLKEVAKRG